MKNQQQQQNIVSSVPKWLISLLTEKFFNACIPHEELPKNEKNWFCADCSEAICPHCCAHHTSHRLLKIRRYVYHDVIRVSDGEKLLECKHVQSYTTNSAKVVFLNQRPQTGHQRSSGLACLICHRMVHSPFRYCSISCKFEHLLKTGCKISKYLRRCEPLTIPQRVLGGGQLTPDSVLEPMSGSILSESGSSTCSLSDLLCPTLACTATTEIVKKKRSNLSVPRKGLRSDVKPVDDVPRKGLRSDVKPVIHVPRKGLRSDVKPVTDVPRKGIRSDVKPVIDVPRKGLRSNVKPVVYFTRKGLRSNVKRAIDVPKTLVENENSSPLKVTPQIQGGNGDSSPLKVTPDSDVRHTQVENENSSPLKVTPDSDVRHTQVENENSSPLKLTPGSDVPHTQVENENGSPIKAAPVCGYEAEPALEDTEALTNCKIGTLVCDCEFGPAVMELDTEVLVSCGNGTPVCGYLAEPALEDTNVQTNCEEGALVCGCEVEQDMMELDTEVLVSSRNGSPNLATQVCGYEAEPALEDTNVQTNCEDDALVCRCEVERDMMELDSEVLVSSGNGSRNLVRPAYRVWRKGSAPRRAPLY